MQEKTKEEIRELFAEAEANSKIKTYKKFTRILYRFPAPGESVITTCGGKIETIQSCSGKEVIVQNIEIGSSAEVYAIEKEKFLKRYELLDNPYNLGGTRWDLAQAKGEIEAFEWEGDTIKFKAPWGEDMLCEKGDMLGRLPTDHDDMYRIARDEFDLTYIIYEVVETKLQTEGTPSYKPGQEPKPGDDDFYPYGTTK